MTLTTHVSTCCMFGFTSALIKLRRDRDFFVAQRVAFAKSHDEPPWFFNFAKSQ